MRLKTIVLAAVVALGLSATSFVAKPAAQAAPAKGKVETYYYFVFTNPARLWTAVNPDFFRGTPVESAVSSLRAQ